MRRISDTQPKKHREREKDEDEGSRSKQDGILEMIRQENARTKDLKLGYPPTERLIAAKRYADQLRAEAANKRVMAPIPNMTWQERGPNNVGGRTRSILVDKNDLTNKTVWVAGVGGGLWKTTDITAIAPTWTSIDDYFSNIAISTDRKSTRLNSSHPSISRMPSSA